MSSWTRAQYINIKREIFLSIKIGFIRIWLAHNKEMKWRKKKIIERHKHTSNKYYKKKKTSIQFVWKPKKCVVQSATCIPIKSRPKFKWSGKNRRKIIIITINNIQFGGKWPIWIGMRAKITPFFASSSSFTFEELQWVYELTLALIRTSFERDLFVSYL